MAKEGEFQSRKIIFWERRKTNIIREPRQWKTIPKLARRYENAHDLGLYVGEEYFDEKLNNPLQNGDSPVTLVRTIDKDEKLPEAGVFLGACMFYSFANYNQAFYDSGIIYKQHEKGIPVLQICDLKLQYQSKDHVKCSWKLDEVSEEECKLQIDGFNENEQGKKIVKFCFATNDIDKLQTHVVDGYEVKYMLRTDAIRLEVELEVVLSSPHLVPDFDSISEEIALEIDHDDKPYTIHILRDQHPTKIQKINSSSINPFKYSIIQNVPRNLDPCMELTVMLKDSGGILVDVGHSIFAYNMPMDQEGFLHFKNGHIKYNVFWGCCFRDGEGPCTGICTCKPAEFIGFRSPGEVLYQEE